MKSSAHDVITVQFEINTSRNPRTPDYEEEKIVLSYNPATEGTVADVIQHYMYGCAR